MKYPYRVFQSHAPEKEIIMSITAPNSHRLEIYDIGKPPTFRAYKAIKHFMTREKKANGFRYTKLCGWVQ